jgi:hypothetical protein
LGRRLELSSTVPFRDAHLKNRIWVTNESPVDLVHRLAGLANDELRAQIMRCVVDIDFESAARNVTPWDDVKHVLFFEMSGLVPFAPGDDGTQLYDTWWGPVTDTDGFLGTVLLRSTREACRRLWYAHHMPKTYIRRYSMESTGVFLELAAWAVSRLDGFDALAGLLAKLQEPDRQPATVPRHRHPHIPATLPVG